MKKTLILLMFPVLSFGQSYDSLKQSILRLQSEQNQLKLNLDRHRDMHALGGSLIAGGAAIIITHFLIQESNPFERNKYTFLTIGSGTFLAGTIVTFDSHKWLRIGRKKRK